MSARRRSTAIAAALAVASAVLLPACGEDDDPSTGKSRTAGDPSAEIRAAFKSFEADLQAGKAESACAQMTRAGQQAAARLGGADGGSCVKTIQAFAQGAGELEQKPSRIVSVTVNGDKAVAKVSDAGRTPVDLPFAKEGGEWKLASLGVGR